MVSLMRCPSERYQWIYQSLDPPWGRKGFQDPVMGDKQHLLTSLDGPASLLCPLYDVMELLAQDERSLVDVVVWLELAGYIGFRVALYAFTEDLFPDRDVVAICMRSKLVEVALLDGLVAKG